MPSGYWARITFPGRIENQTSIFHLHHQKQGQKLKQKYNNNKIIMILNFILLRKKYLTHSKKIDSKKEFYLPFPYRSEQESLSKVWGNQTNICRWPLVVPHSSWFLCMIQREAQEWTQQELEDKLCKTNAYNRDKIYWMHTIYMTFSENMQETVYGIEWGYEVTFGFTSLSFTFCLLLLLLLCFLFVVFLLQCEKL